MRGLMAGSTAAFSVADIVGMALVFLAIGWVSRRVARRPNEFMVAERRLTLFPLVATLVMTEFNTSTLLAFSAAGYRAGPMALALPLVFLIGLGFYTLTVARAWKRFDRLSVAQLFTARYGPGLGRLASALLLLAMTGFSATYVKSLTLVVAPWLPGINHWWLSAALVVVTLGVLLTGGLATVVRSDIVGFVLTLLVVALLLALGLTRHGGLSHLGSAFPAEQLAFAPWRQWQTPALPFRFVLTLIVLTCFTYITAPWYGQKIFAARDERTAFLAVGITAVLVFALYGALVMAAALFRLDDAALVDPQLVTPIMIQRWLPAGLRGVGLAMLCVAALTTLAGVWSAMGTMLTADFQLPGLARLTGMRTAIVIIAIACWLGANLFVDDILDRLILANIPVAALAFALLAGFHWPRATRAGAWASVVVGVTWGVGCYVLVGEAGGYTWPWAMYGIPLIMVTGVVVSLMTAAGVRERSNSS